MAASGGVRCSASPLHACEGHAQRVQQLEDLPLAQHVGRVQQAEPSAAVRFGCPVRGGEHVVQQVPNGAGGPRVDGYNNLLQTASDLTPTKP